MREYIVAEANRVARGPVSLTDWLNEQAKHGWKLVAVDQGFIYMVKEPRR